MATFLPRESDRRCGESAKESARARDSSQTRHGFHRATAASRAACVRVRAVRAMILTVASLLLGAWVASPLPPRATRCEPGA